MAKDRRRPKAEELVGWKMDDGDLVKKLSIVVGCLRVNEYGRVFRWKVCRLLAKAERSEVMPLLDIVPRRTRPAIGLGASISPRRKVQQ